MILIKDLWRNGRNSQNWIWPSREDTHTKKNLVSLLRTNIFSQNLWKYFYTKSSRSDPLWALFQAAKIYKVLNRIYKYLDSQLLKNGQVVFYLNKIFLLTWYSSSLNCISWDWLRFDLVFWLLQILEWYISESFGQVNLTIIAQFLDIQIQIFLQVTFEF